MMSSHAWVTGGQLGLCGGIGGGAVGAWLPRSAYPRAPGGGFWYRASEDVLNCRTSSGVGSCASTVAAAAGCVVKSKTEARFPNGLPAGPPEVLGRRHDDMF